MSLSENGMDNSKMTIIGTYPSEIYAEIARQKLASRGIEAFISQDDFGRMQPSLQLTEGVKLEVVESVRKKAERILNEIE